MNGGNRGRQKKKEREGGGEEHREARKVGKYETENKKKRQVSSGGRK